MIPLAEFSKRENISEAKAIERIREGIYTGQLVNGQWFIEDAESVEPDEIEKASIEFRFGAFLRGCLAGIAISAIFGLLTYPWDQPGFEGAAGYHMLMMIYATPVLTLGSGIVYWLYRKWTKDAEQ